MIRAADFSLCKTWRYSLTRIRDENLPRVCFIMFNPSTADTFVDDATTLRVLDYVQRWGFGYYEAVNLFAFRSRWPQDLKEVSDPIGNRNDKAIIQAVGLADLVVAAWGVNGVYMDRNQKVLKMLRGKELHCLKVTKDGHPSHPLYLRKNLVPVKFR